MPLPPSAPRLTLCCLAACLAGAACTSGGLPAAQARTPEAPAPPPGRDVVPDDAPAAARPTPPPPAPLAACDADSLGDRLVRRPDTLFLVVRAPDGATPLPRPWADLVAQQVGTRLALPTPLDLGVVAPLRPGRAAAGDTVATVLVAAVRAVVRRDGRVASLALLARSPDERTDLALVEAVRGADTARALLAPPDSLGARAAAVVLGLAVGRPAGPGGAGAVTVAHPVALAPRTLAVLAAGAEPEDPIEPPPYPADERAAGREGTAEVEAVVRDDGALVPGTLRVVAHDGEPFARAALAHAARLRFRPARVGGCPVALVVRLPYAFRIDGGAPPSIAPPGAAPAPPSR